MTLEQDILAIINQIPAAIEKAFMDVLVLRHPGHGNQKTHGNRFGAGQAKESLRRLKDDKGAREQYKQRARKKLGKEAKPVRTPGKMGAKIEVPNPGGKPKILGTASYSGKKITTIGQNKEHALTVHHLGGESYEIHDIRTYGPAQRRGQRPLVGATGREMAMNMARDILESSKGLKADGIPVLSDEDKIRIKKKYFND